MTLQVTAVLVELETAAENESVSPSNTLPELGLTVMEICGGGGGVVPAPPPPPPQAVRNTLRVKAASAMQNRREEHEHRAVALGFVRVCGRGRMFLANADGGPAKAPGSAGAKVANCEILWVF